MQGDGRGLKVGNDLFARLEPGRFSAFPFFLMKATAERRVGSNGWPVMTVLCRRIYVGGRLGKCGREWISSATGMTYVQIARGMFELRDKGGSSSP